MARFLLILGVLLGFLAKPATVRADQFADYQFALSAYSEGDYGEARDRFEALLPSLRDPTLVTQSRQYLAASFVHLNRPDDAREQFLALLREDGDFALPRHDFSTAVYQVFQAAQRAHREELARRERDEQAERERLRRMRLERMLRERERMARLEQLASEMLVEQRNSRALALLPFGVGQFRNGNRGLGMGFAISESFLFVGSLMTWGWHRYLRGLEPEDRGSFNTRERSVRITNQVVTGVLAGIALAGILEAQIRFKAVIRETRPRELPDDLPDLEADPELEIGLGPGTASVRLRF